jgi:Family of unknown function (DUF6221)
MNADDLAGFLKARLDEDEAHAQKDLWAVARSTAQGDWDARYGYNLPQSYIAAPADSRTYIAEFTSHRASPPLADGEDDLHACDVGLASRMVRAAKPRAKRQLREVEAKRAILAVHAPREGGDGAGAEIQVCQTCSWDGGAGDVEGDPYPCETLRFLAAVYSDHPDYQEEWKP